MATRFDDSAVRALSERGMGGMKNAEALACFGRALHGTEAQVAVLPVNWQKWAEAYPAYVASPFLSKVAAPKPPAARAASGSVSVRDELLQTSIAERKPKLITYLRQALGAILGFPAQDIDPLRSMSEFGVDSLMALEFKNRIDSELGISIPMVRFLQGPRLEEIAAQIAQGLLSQQNKVSVTQSPITAGPAEYPLSYGQRALWFVHNYVPESPAYNIAFTAKAQPRLDIEAFGRAHQKLVNRHAALRTIFTLTGEGQPVQRVLSEAKAEISVLEVRASSESALRDQIIPDYQRPFELDRPVARLSVFRRDDGDVLLFNVHHLVFDAWSVRILFEDIRKLYAAELHDAAGSLPSLDAEYFDYVQAQAELVDRAETANSWRHWESVLAGELPVLRLQGARPRPASPTLRGGSISLALSGELSAGLQRVARDYKTTSYTVLLTAFQVLLQQFTGQDDIIVGSPVSGRNEPRWANVMGYFINMLPMRADLSGNPAFIEQLARTSAAVLSALAHQDFPFPLMVERLRLRRDPGQTPIFQATFNLMSDRSGELGPLFTGAPDCAVEFAASTLSSYVIPQQEGQFDVGLEIADVGGALSGTLKYSDDALDRPTAATMAITFCELLKRVVEDPQVRIGELSLGGIEERSEREEITF